MSEVYNPFAPWPQSKIDAFTAYLTKADDEQILSDEENWRNFGTREGVITKNEERLSAGREKILPHETDKRYETLIALYKVLYDATRQPLLTEIEKRGLKIA